MWRRLFQGFGSSRVRKQASELTVADFTDAPAWEFCLDEERAPGQDECTVRPLVKGPIQARSHDVLVACSLLCSAGKELFGVLQPCQHSWDGAGSRFFVEVWLDRPAGQILKDPLLKTYNPVVREDSPRIDLSFGPVANVQELIGVAYRVLGVTADEMWPLKVRPRRPVPNWPLELILPGWRHGPGSNYIR